MKKLLAFALVLPGIACGGGTKETSGTSGTSGATASSSGSTSSGTSVSSTTSSGTATSSTTGTAATTSGGAPSLSISPLSSEVLPGQTETLTATLTGISGTITWAVEGAGSLQPAAGPTVTFTAPATGGVGQYATVTATVGSLTAKAGVKLDPPLTDAGLPLGGSEYTYLDRVSDVEVIGVDNLTTANDLLIVGTNSAFGVTSTTAYTLWQNDGGSANDPVFLDQPEAAFTSNQLKVAHSANLDDDPPEETVVLSWLPTGATTVTQAAAALTILDPTPLADGGAPSMAVLTPMLVDQTGAPMTLNVDPACVGGSSLSWETAACSFNYDYDLALADVDGDGFADVVITGTVSGVTPTQHGYGAQYSGTYGWISGTGEPPVKRGMLWVFSSMHASNTASTGKLKLLNSAPLTGIYTGNTYSGTYVARVAAGSLSPDHSRQIAVAWMDAARWESIWAAIQPNPILDPFALGSNSLANQPISYRLYQAATLTQIGSDQLTDSSNCVINIQSGDAPNLNTFSLDMVDIDGDGIQELVFSGMNTKHEATSGFPSITPGGDDDILYTLIEAHGNLGEVQVDGGADPAQLPLLAQLPAVAGLSSGPYPATSVGGTFSAFYPTRWTSVVNNYRPPASTVLTGAGINPRAQELVVGNQLIGFAPSSGGALPYTPTVLESIVPAASYYSGAPQAATDIQAGDLNGDGADDMVVLFHDGTVQGYGWICEDATSPCDNEGWHQFYNYPANNLNSGQNVPAGIVVPAALDNKSLVVRFAERVSRPNLPDGGAAPDAGPSHSIIYKNPLILALLESPPVLPSAGQDGTASDGTTYSTGTSTSKTVGGNFNLSFGATVGFDTEETAGLGISTKILEISDKVTFEFEQSFAWENTQQQTISTQYETYGGDLVVYSATPYDRYQYVVVSDPDVAAIGSLMTVDIPKPPTVSSCDRNYFNTIVNPNGIQITSALLPDTPYVLDSYPSYSALPAGAQTSQVDVGNGITLTRSTNSICTSSKTQVGQGATATTAVECDSSNSSSFTRGQSFSITNDFELQLAVAVFGFNVGVSGGDEMTWSHDSSIDFSGIIGNLPKFYPDGGDDYAVNQYQWAVTGYQEKLALSDGGVVQSFFVVGYSVDGYTGPTPDGG